MAVLSTYRQPRFAYRRPPELQLGTSRRQAVIVVGAGPVGLAAAIDLAQRGSPVVLLDDDDTVAVGSRGVCYAKRTLEVLDRLGVGDACVAKGVSWNVGRTFLREEEVFNFRLLSQPDHKRPGMVNLQQYYLEEFLVRRAQQLPGIDLRWKNRVVSVQQDEDGVCLQVETPDGAYALEGDWLIAADENLLHSTRSTDFISPKSKASLNFRNAVLTLARNHPFARALVNSGRLSVPSFLLNSSLNMADADDFRGEMSPGAPMDDAPVRAGDRDCWLLDVVGSAFVLLWYLDDPLSVAASTAAMLAEMATAVIPISVLLLTPRGGVAPAGLRVVEDRCDRFVERYDARNGTAYLCRPDQHVCARWRQLDGQLVWAALARATGNA